MPLQSSCAKGMTTLDIACEISSWLSLPDASLAKGICLTWLEAVEHRLRASFGPHRLISLYFDDWTQFIALMASRDILLAGSTVLDVFAERAVSPHTQSLVVLVESPTGRDVVAFLKDRGYMAIPLDDRDVRDAGKLGLLPALEMPKWYFGTETYRSYSPRNVDYVERLVLPRPDVTDCRFVEVIYTTYSPALTVVRFDNTVDMTFMGWDRGYCLFPVATVHERRGICLSRGLSVFRTAACERSGYKITPALDIPGRVTDGIVKWGSLRPGQRWFGDAATFVVHLPLPEIPYVVPSPYTWQTNGFRLTYTTAAGPSRFRRGTVWTPEISAIPMTHRCLDGWTYASSPEFLSHVVKYIGERSVAHGMFWRYGIGSPGVVSMLPTLRDSFELQEEQDALAEYHGTTDWDVEDIASGIEGEDSDDTGSTHEKGYSGSDMDAADVDDDEDDASSSSGCTDMVVD
ncbi:hypothetical protein AURDEDRAFT_158419 [Auricularia subglabra TFB-10046 SS5]|nr:hypothetical protein AURDEDRAFT_158419 [Auricularia subglabra TFB-10046 SS5]